MKVALAREVLEETGLDRTVTIVEGDAFSTCALAGTPPASSSSTPRSKTISNSWA